MRAFAAQIIPSDKSLPGADEAGAVHFVDRAFGKPFFADIVPVVRAGLADHQPRTTNLTGTVVHEPETILESPTADQCCWFGHLDIATQRKVGV